MPWFNPYWEPAGRAADCNLRARVPGQLLGVRGSTITGVWGLEVMKKLVAVLLLAAATGGTAQDRKTTEVQVRGHVYEPAKLEPTDGRVSALKLPAGFGVTKFAEFSNPRMIAVAEDGTVYVTQREPGTPVAITRHQPGRGRRRAGGGRREKDAAPTAGSTRAAPLAPGLREHVRDEPRDRLAGCDLLSTVPTHSCSALPGEGRTVNKQTCTHALHWSPAKIDESDLHSFLLLLPQSLGR